MKYAVVKKSDAGRWMMGGCDAKSHDSLFTRDRNFCLFSPLADCLGAVAYDTKIKF